MKASGRILQRSGFLIFISRADRQFGGKKISGWLPVQTVKNLKSVFFTQLSLIDQYNVKYSTFCIIMACSASKKIYFCAFQIKSRAYLLTRNGEKTAGKR